MPDRKPTIAEIRERMQTPSKVLWHNHAPADISVLLTALESTQGELEDALGNRDLQELRDELADCKGRLAGYESSDREVRGKWNAELKEVGRLHREVAARDARIAELEAKLAPLVELLAHVDCGFVVATLMDKRQELAVRQTRLPCTTEIRTLRERRMAALLHAIDILRCKPTAGEGGQGCESMLPRR